MSQPRPRGRIALRLAQVAVPLLAGFFPLHGCSLIVDTNTSQCKTSIDCRAKGEVFVNATCVDSLCVQAPGCTTHAQCFDTLGEPAICRPFDQTCARLFSPECRQVDMDEKALTALQANPDTILLGVFVSLRTAEEGTGRPVLNSTTVAVKEINDSQGGIPALVSPGTTRPLAFVACDHSGGQAAAALRHLVEDLRVPAIIGPQFSGVLKDTYTTATTGNTLLISPSATATDIASLPDGGLVWRTAPPDVFQAAAIAALITDKLAGEIKAALPGNTAPIRLALLRKDDSYGSGLERDIGATVALNGEPLSPTNTNYKVFAYGNPVKDQPGTQQKSDVAVAELLKHKPHLIAIVGTDEAASVILPAVEARWTETAYRPRYIVTDGVQVPELPPVIKADATAGGDLRKRVFGTTPGTLSKQYAKFLVRYDSIFPGTQFSPNVFGTAGAYDATYMLAYSIFVAGAQPLTGGLIAQGFGRLINGEPITLGSTESTTTAFKSLRDGANIDIDGASGPLTFDLMSGEAPSDIQIWCVSTSSTMVNTGLFLDASGKLTGTFACP